MASCELTVMVTRSESISREWVGHCLELDVVSQGTSPAHALNMVAEAVAIVVLDDLSANRDPLKFRSRAPVEDWEAYGRVIRESQLVNFSEIGDGSGVKSLVVTMNLSVPKHPAMDVEEDDERLPVVPVRTMAEYAHNSLVC